MAIARCEAPRRYAATVIIVGLGCASSVGCAAKTPAEAVQLSRIVGQQIGVVQASHEMAVAYYFDLSRERVEDFLVPSSGRVPADRPCYEIYADDPRTTKPEKFVTDSHEGGLLLN